MIYRILLLALGCMVFNATLWAANHTQVAPAGIVKNWFVGLESSALFPVFKGQHSNLPFAARHGELKAKARSPR